MPEGTSAKIPNKILAALPTKEYERLFPHLEHISLPLGEVLYSAGDRIKHVYFPNTGVVSLVTHLKDGASVEVGLIGREGTVGISIALKDNVSQNQAIVQIAGGAMRMKASDFKAEFNRGGRLQTLLMRYVQAMLKQTSQTAACNRNHNIGERLARWLLMCQDRVESPELKLTQEFIAEMLGTRRAGVSEAAKILQTKELIKYSRGRINVLDRQGLEDFSCECYEVNQKEFDRLLGS